MTRSSQFGWAGRFVAGAALVFWVALALQLSLTLRLSYSTGNSTLRALWVYFAYFTILTNMLAALTLTAPALRPDSVLRRVLVRPRTITAVAVYMLLVGIAYNLLLRNAWQPHGWQLIADVLLHSINPLLFVGYWYLFGRDGALGYSAIAGWSVYPLAYLVYALARGLGGDFYAYPFIDIGALGSARVLLNALCIGLGFAAISAGLIAWGRRAHLQTEE